MYWSETKNRRHKPLDVISVDNANDECVSQTEERDASVCAKQAIDTFVWVRQRAEMRDQQKMWCVCVCVCVSEQIEERERERGMQIESAVPR